MFVVCLFAINTIATDAFSAVNAENLAVLSSFNRVTWDDMREVERSLKNTGFYPELSSQNTAAHNGEVSFTDVPKEFKESVCFLYVNVLISKLIERYGAIVDADLVNILILRQLGKQSFSPERRYRIFNAKEGISLAIHEPSEKAPSFIINYYADYQQTASKALSLGIGKIGVTIKDMRVAEEKKSATSIPPDEIQKKYSFKYATRHELEELSDVIYEIGTREIAKRSYFSSRVLPQIKIWQAHAGDLTSITYSKKSNSPDIENFGEFRKEDGKKIKKNARKVGKKLIPYLASNNMGDLTISLVDTPQTAGNSYRVHTSPDGLDYTYSIAFMDRNSRKPVIYLSKDIFRDLSCDLVFEEIIKRSLSHLYGKMNYSSDDKKERAVLPYADEFEGRSRRRIEKAIASKIIKDQGSAVKLESIMNYMFSREDGFSKRDKKVYLALVKRFIAIEGAAALVKSGYILIPVLSGLLLSVGIPGGMVLTLSSVLFISMTFFGAICREATTIYYKIKNPATPVWALLLLTWLPEFVGFLISIPVQIGMNMTQSRIRKEINASRKTDRGRFYKAWRTVGTFCVLPVYFIKSFGAFVTQIREILKLRNATKRVVTALGHSTLPPEKVRLVLTDVYMIAEAIKDKEVVSSNESEEKEHHLKVRGGKRRSTDFLKDIKSGKEVIYIDSHHSYNRLWNRYIRLKAQYVHENNGKEWPYSIDNIYVFDLDSYLEGKNSSAKVKSIRTLEEYIYLKRGEDSSVSSGESNGYPGKEDVEDIVLNESYLLVSQDELPADLHETEEAMLVKELLGAIVIWLENKHTVSAGSEDQQYVIALDTSWMPELQRTLISQAGTLQMCIKRLSRRQGFQDLHFVLNDSPEKLYQLVTEAKNKNDVYSDNILVIGKKEIFARNDFKSLKEIDDNGKGAFFVKIMNIPFHGLPALMDIHIEKLLAKALVKSCELSEQGFCEIDLPPGAIFNATEELVRSYQLRIKAFTTKA